MSLIHLYDIFIVFVLLFLRYCVALLHCELNIHKFIRYRSNPLLYQLDFLDEPSDSFIPVIVVNCS